MKFLRLLTLILAATSVAHAQFSPAPKPVELTGFPNAGRATFGYITVPENRASGSARTIQLAVVVVAAKTQPALADPVFYIVGGPGGCATLSSAGVYLFESLNDTRDIVFVDPRGAGYSEPFLGYEGHDNPPSLRETAQNRNRFVAQGIDLSAYNTTEVAQDYEAARIALGYGPINLVANSYGTSVAQEMLRRFPASFRSVVMTGNSPADDPFLPASAGIQQGGFNALFRDVDHSRLARKAYPNFKRRYYGLVRLLNASPVEVRIPHRTTGKLEKVTISGNALIGKTSAMLQRTETIRLIPLLTTQLRRHQYGSLVRRFFAPRDASPRSNAASMYLSVLGTDFATPGYVRSTVHGIKQIGNPTLRADLIGLAGLARQVVWWQVPFQPGTTRNLPFSNVRTLLLNGEMDAQTPANGGAIIAAGLSNSIDYVYPRIGHAVGFFQGPDSAAAIAFIRDPSLTPPYSLEGLVSRNFYARRAVEIRSRIDDDWEAGLIDPPVAR